MSVQVNTCGPVGQMNPEVVRFFWEKTDEVNTSAKLQTLDRSDFFPRITQTHRAKVLHLSDCH